jgi:16S rRNA (cytosine1407-C5)-methyltransferase
MAQRAEEGWHAAHKVNYGADRWETLHESLHRDVNHLCFLNPFLPAEAQTRLQEWHKLERTSVLGGFSFEVPEDSQKQLRIADCSTDSTIFVEVPPPAQDPEHTGLSPLLFIDGASIIVALSLRVCDSDQVLEVCAAPGGKSLVLASAMFGRTITQEARWSDTRGRLVCNEVSKSKASRLQRTLREFVSPSLFDTGHLHGAHVVFTSAEAGTPSNSMERNGPYDKILLDAPCVCDRRLRRGSGAELGRWSAGKVKVSAERQLKLIYNALWLLKEGGILLYCTTALSPEECDGVIESILLKTRLTFVLEVVPLEEDFCRMVPGLAAEHTDWGTRILPDKTSFGPVYFSRLRLVKRIHESVQHIPHF